MDIQKEFALFSGPLFSFIGSVAKGFPLNIKGDESEKGERVLQVDVQHMLKQTPYQKTTETVMEGIPDGLSSAIDTGKSTFVLKNEHVKQSKVYSEAQELARTSELVPPIGKTYPVEDGVKDKEEKGDKIGLQEVLIDIGTDGGSDHSSSEKKHIAKVVKRCKSSEIASKKYGMSYRLVVIYLFLTFGGISTQEAVQYQRTKQQSGISYQVKTIHPLNKSESCPAQVNLQCDEDEKAICIRNNTWENLVVACVKNISMTYGCPVLTTARNDTHQFYLVQLDLKWNCSTCPQYGLWDVENYPQCLKTNNDTQPTKPTAQETKENKLSVGEIVGIITGPLALVVIVCFPVLLWICGCLEKIKQRMRTCRERERDIEQEMSDSMVEN